MWVLLEEVFVLLSDFLHLLHKQPLLVVHLVLIVDLLDMLLLLHHHALLVCQRLLDQHPFQVFLIVFLLLPGLQGWFSPLLESLAHFVCYYSVDLDENLIWQSLELQLDLGLRELGILDSLGRLRPLLLRVPLRHQLANQVDFVVEQPFHVDVLLDLLLSVDHAQQLVVYDFLIRVDRGTWPDLVVPLSAVGLNGLRFRLFFQGGPLSSH